MNRTLFHYEFRKSLKMLIIFAAIITMYIGIIIWMYDPKMMKSLSDMYDTMPQVMAAVGMTKTETTMIGFMISYLYGFILIVFPMIYLLIRARSMVAGKVEKNTMASLLAAPVRRRTIMSTEIGVLVTTTLILLVYATAAELVFAELLFPGKLDTSTLIHVNLGLIALQIFIGSVCMLCSASFNDAGLAVGVSGGVMAVMYLIQMIRNTGISDELDKLKYCTFFTLFDPTGMAQGNTDAVSGAIALTVCGVILYLISGVIFSRRDLSL